MLGVKEDCADQAILHFGWSSTKFDSITIGRQFEVRGWKCGAVGMENMEGPW